MSYILQTRPAPIQPSPPPTAQKYKYVRAYVWARQAGSDRGKFISIFGINCSGNANPGPINQGQRRLALKIKKESEILIYY